MLVNGKLELFTKDGKLVPKIDGKPPAVAPQAREETAVVVAAPKPARGWAPRVVRAPFSRAERIMLEAICNRAVATYGMISGDLHSWDPTGGPTDPKGSIMMMMSRLRRKLRLHGITITTWRGEGYAVDREGRAALLLLLEMTRAGNEDHAIDLPSRRHEHARRGDHHLGV